MKNQYYIFTLLALFFSTVAAEAQVQSTPVNFIIKRIVNRPENNRLGMLLEVEAETSDGILSGPAVLNMCSCYCDSIWDAWPAEVGGGIPATGTMYFISDGEGGIPAGPNTGVLGINMVEGGIERETEFRVSMKYKLDN